MQYDESENKTNRNTQITYTNHPPAIQSTMQDMFTQYPIGSAIEDKHVTGYRQMHNKSSLQLSDGKWKDI